MGDRGVEDTDLGRPGGLSSQATEPVPVSALRASIPDAGESLRKCFNLRCAANALGDDDLQMREMFIPKVIRTLDATADWLEAIASNAPSEFVRGKPVKFDPADPAHDPKYQLQLLSNGICRAAALLAKDARGDQSMTMPEWVLREWNGRVTLIAQAIEARRAETAKTGSVEDESAVPKGCAQPLPSREP